MPTNKETFSMEKDIFSVGTWNGDEYTEQDLDEMIANFKLLSEKEPNYRVPLKVDLFKNAKPEDSRHGGQPAVGWITELKKEGAKLFARIENIPRTIKELIETKAYRQVSSEIRWNMKHGNDRLRRVLVGVALLGVEAPGVSNLEEFAALYALKDEDMQDVKTYIVEENKQEGNIMTPEEIQKLQEEKAKLEADAKAAKEYSAKLEAEKKVIEAQVEAEKQKAAELANAKRDGEIKNFIAQKKAEGKILPAHEDTVIKLFQSLEDSKTVKFTNADGKETEKTQRSMMEDFINSLPKLVEFKEKSQAGSEELKEFKERPEAEAGNVESQRLDYMAKEYAKKNNCSYRDALIEVSKNKKGE